MKTSSQHTKKAWDERAKQGNYYKGEKFYTITPLPYYLKRREIMLGLARNEMKNAHSIMDFGCGDGWYLTYFSRQPDDKSGRIFSGLDISQEMVKRAKAINPKMRIYVSSTGIRPKERYDLIYTFATLAHIGEDSITAVFANIAESLESKGRFMLFEQTAPHTYAGSSFIRRTINDYTRLGNESGLKLKKSYLLRFRAHAFFERHIAKRYVRWCKGDNEYEKRLEANSHKVYRTLSRLFLFIDREPVHENAQSGWGNVLMIFEKAKQ